MTKKKGELLALGMLMYPERRKQETIASEVKCSKCEKSFGSNAAFKRHKGDCNKAKMKIIFLDIDGVLNGYPWMYGARKEMENRMVANPFLRDLDSWTIEMITTINRKKVELLEKILSETQAKIVVSSAWRTDGVEKLKLYMMLSGGFLVSESIIDVTGYRNDARRDLEIKEWLKNRKDVESFVILDDELTHLPDFKDEVIKTEMWSDGLQEEHVQMAIEKLLKHS